MGNNIIKADIMEIGGKIEERTLNGYIVSVITPKERISYEEGVRRIDKILAEASK